MRKGQERVTGLHFFEVKPYFDALEEQIVDLDLLICNLAANDQRIPSLNATSDEKILYQMIDSARSDWIDALKTSAFRPHHGAHMGIFRHKETKDYKNLVGNVLGSGLSKKQAFWLSDIYSVFVSEDIMHRYEPLYNAFPKLHSTISNFYEFVDFYKDKVLTT